jgi:hypothetical protein
MREQCQDNRPYAGGKSEGVDKKGWVFRRAPAAMRVARESTKSLAEKQKTSRAKYQSGILEFKGGAARRGRSVDCGSEVMAPIVVDRGGMVE